MKHRCWKICMVVLILPGLLIQFGCRPKDATDPGLTSQVPTATSEKHSDEPGTELSPAPSETSFGMMPADESDESLQAKLALAPDIQGTEKKIAEMNGLRRVVYVTLPDNPYQIPAGQIAGVYKLEVFTGDEQTGGIALTADVVAWHFKKALDAMPQEQAKWLLTLPLDLSDCRSLSSIRIDLSAKPLIDRPYYIRITADSEALSVVNILDNSQQTVIGTFKMYGLHYLISQTSQDSTSIIEGQEMAFLFVIVRFSEPPEDAAYAYGDRIGITSEPVLAGLTSVRGPFREHDYNCILKIEGCPVFLMANPEK